MAGKRTKRGASKRTGYNVGGRDGKVPGGRMMPNNKNRAKARA